MQRQAATPRHRRPNPSAFRVGALTPAVCTKTESAPEDVGLFISHRWYGPTSPGPTWQVRLDLAVRDRAVVITGIHFAPEPEALHQNEGRLSTLGITAREANTLVRDAQFSDLLADAGQQLRTMPYWMALAEHGFVTSREQMESVKASAGSLDYEALRKGRKGYPDDFYRRVAIRYLELCDDNERKGGSVLHRLAQEATDEKWTPDRTGDVPKETVRSWLREAKRRQMLETPNRGVRGGGAGPNLYPKEK